MTALASPQKTARKGAAQVIANIAALELPKNQWHDVIPSLVGAAQGTNKDFKIASLQTLGYICEEVEKSALSESEVDLILSAIVPNIMPNIDVQEIKMTAIMALYSCIPFCSKNFKVEKEKELLLTNIINCIQHPDDEIKKKAMQCLLEVVRCYYDYIGGKTLELLGHATFNEIKKDDNEEVALQAIEVWCSICDEEIDRIKKNNLNEPCRNYIDTAHSVLVPILLDSLKKIEVEEGDWDVSVLSALCLSLVAEILKDKIVDPVLAFAGKNMISTEWKDKKAGMLAFIALLKGPNRNNINNLIVHALGTFLGLLQDPKPKVRITAAWAFNKIAESNSEVMIQPNIFPTVISAFIASLRDVPMVSSNICAAIHSVATALGPGESQPTSLLSTVFKELLQALWSNAFRGDAFSEESTLARNSFETIGNIIQNAARDAIPSLEPVFKMVVETFASTVNGTFIVPAHNADFQGYLCSVLYSVSVKLTGKISAKMASDILDLIIQSFAQRKSVYDEGIMACDGLLLAISKEFKPLMTKFGPYLAYALGNTEDTPLSRAAVGFVEDLSHEFEAEMAPYLAELVPLIMQIIQNKDSDRGVKLSAITALGDFAFATNKAFSPYLPSLLEILKGASALSLQPPQEVFFQLFHSIF